MFSLRTNAGPQPRPPLFYSLINDALLQLSTDRDEALLQVGGVHDFCLINSFLYQPPDPVVDWIEVW